MHSLIFFLTVFTSAFALQKTKIALNWKPEPEFGGFYAAEVDGAYKKHGLQVEIMPGGSGTPIVQMIASGRVKFGIVSGDELLIARSHHHPVVALYAIYQTNPMCIMAHAERDLKTLGDVFNAPGTISLEKGLPYATYLLKKFAGNVNATIVPYSGGVGNFLHDRGFSQQCFVGSEPLVAEKGGANVHTFMVADEGFNPYTAVLATTETYAKKHQKLVRDLVAAVREGWRDYLKDPKPANKVMAGLNKAMSLPTFNASAEAQRDLMKSSDKKIGLGGMTDERWNQLAKQLVDLKLISSVPAGKPYLPMN